MKKPRTLEDLKNDPRVDEIHSELENGFSGRKTWWCYLKAGWQDQDNPTCHTIHEDTIKEVCHLVHRAIKYPDDPELKHFERELNKCQQQK